MKRCTPLLAVLVAFGCSPEQVPVTSADASSGESSGTAGTETGTATGEDLCGNGVVDPGEECEPSDPFCDVCTSDCRADPLPGNEWMVALEHIDVDAYPFEAGWDVLTTSSAAWVVVRGSSIDAQPYVYLVSSTGDVIGSHGPAEHGFDELLDHAVGVAGDGVLLGRIGGVTHLRRFFDDATFDPPIASSDPLADRVAITSQSLVVLQAGGAAQALDMLGLPLWSRLGPYDQLGNVDDRVVLASASSHEVEFVSADGSEVLVWPWWGSFEPGYTRIASVPALLLLGETVSGFGGVDVHVLDLWTGEETWMELFTGAASGLEVDPSGSALDATPNGWPLLGWSRCWGDGDPLSCLGSLHQEGVGGPDDLWAVPKHDCDLTASTRIGADGGVFMLSEQLDGTLVLVRRTTL